MGPSPSFALLKGLIALVISVRWDSEAPKKNRVFLLQSVFLRCQFYEVQLHVHRIFALRDPPDPELSATSMIICKNAAKQCIAVVDSVKGALFTSLHSFGLMVRHRAPFFYPNDSTQIQKPVFTSIIFLIILSWKTGGMDDNSPEYHAIEVGTKLVDLASERYRFAKCSDLITQRLTFRRWRACLCVGYAPSVLATRSHF